MREEQATMFHASVSPVTVTVILIKMPGIHHYRRLTVNSQELVGPDELISPDAIALCALATKQ